MLLKMCMEMLTLHLESGIFLEKYTSLYPSSCKVLRVFLGDVRVSKLLLKR